MVILVPFDGGALAEAALDRAVELANPLGESVVALAVVPRNNGRYARERGWIDADEEFDARSVLADLRGRTNAIAAEAEFRHLVVDRYATAGEIATHIREVARDIDASVVAVGSENAGRIATGVASVGSTVAAGTTYDVLIVRNADSSRSETPG